ncbi:MAG: alanine racemase, partial [Candidatus Hydrogenedentes bacterium]|nr:alanine racemase [Candidatus Hydrogenedentota bacterium]
MDSIAQSTFVVDLGAYTHNLRVVRDMIPKDCAVMAVVKGNAYGHGAVAIAQRALQAGASMLGVATVEEAIVLRSASVTAPIMVLVQPPAEAFPEVIENNLRLCLSDVGATERLGELARKHNRVIPIHCKVDTGMGRQGLELDNVITAMRHMTRVSHIDIEGVATHFSSSEDIDDPATANQIRVFKQILKQIEKEGIPYEMAHAANSGAIVAHPTSTFDMVRPGLMTYGVWPTETRPGKIPLRPVGRWESKVVLIKELPSGWSIGYGHTFTTERPTRTAVIPVGYGDGYKAQFGNNADVL